MNAEYMKLQGLMEGVADLALSDPVDFIRADAAWTLRHAGGQRVVETLIKCLADPYARTRRHARIALRGAVAAELAKERSPVRERALETLIWVLANHGDKPYATSQAVELLTKLAQLLQSPIRRLAVALNAPIQQLATTLGQIAENKDSQES